MLSTKKNNFEIAVADKNGKWWYKSCCFKHKCAPIKKWNECVKCKTEDVSYKCESDCKPKEYVLTCACMWGDLYT